MRTALQREPVGRGGRRSQRLRRGPDKLASNSPTLSLHKPPKSWAMVRKAPDVMAEDTDAAIRQVQTMISADLQLKVLRSMPPSQPPHPQPETAAATEASRHHHQGQTLATNTRFTPAQIAPSIRLPTGNKNGRHDLVPYISRREDESFFASIEPDDGGGCGPYLRATGQRVGRDHGRRLALDRERPRALTAAASARTTAR